MDDRDRLLNAKRQVARLKGFYIHAAVFVLVMLALIALNVFLGQPYWVAWVLLGWGLGLVGHAIGVFGPGFAFAKDWEARKIKQLLDEKPKA